MLELFSEAQLAALAGLAGGIVLGLAARLGRFCTLGAIEDLLYGKDGRRIWMWGMAIGSAILVTQLAITFGYFEPASTVYLTRDWLPAASILGGLTFGYGTALAGNCGYGALARLGGGDLRSFVIVLVMGLATYVVLSGPLAGLRIWLFPVEDAPSLQGFGYQGSGVNSFAYGVAALMIGATIWRLRHEKMMLFWALLVGLAVSSGWIGTFWIATEGFASEPVETHSFAAPIGDTIFYGMTASGTTVSFSVGSIIGVLIGAFIGSLARGLFRWEACEDPRELRRQITGAALMGIGAALAFGCSIGQGISAFSTLAYSAPVTAAAIFIGAALGLRQMIEGFGRG